MTSGQSLCRAWDTFCTPCRRRLRRVGRGMFDHVLPRLTVRFGA